MNLVGREKEGEGRGRRRRREEADGVERLWS